MELFIPILECILVIINIWLATENEGTSRMLSVICAALWLMSAIVNIVSIMSQL